MISIELPCGVRFGAQPITAFRPLVALCRSPREVRLWLLWFTVAVTWYETNRRGQNAVRVNNELAWGVFP